MRLPEKRIAAACIRKLTEITPLNNMLEGLYILLYLHRALSQESHKIRLGVKLDLIRIPELFGMELVAPLELT